MGALKDLHEKTNSVAVPDDFQIVDGKDKLEFQTSGNLPSRRSHSEVRGLDEAWLSSTLPAKPLAVLVSQPHTYDHVRPNEHYRAPEDLFHARESMLELREPPYSSERLSHDPEEGALDHSQVGPQHVPSSESILKTTICTESYGEDEEADLKRHKFWILIYLAFLGPMLALPTSLYAIIGLVLLSPFYIWTKPGALTAGLYRFLAPPIHLQLGLIFSSYIPTDTKTSNVVVLVLVNISSPVPSFGIAVAAWVAASFWFFAAILGEPAGKDGKDDGTAAVMEVRAWWERWLMRGLR